jgi:hypothetical protein
MQKSRFHFKKNVTGTFVSFYDEDCVATLKIIKSGWTDKYHCIVEWGEYEDADYELFTEEQIRERYLVEF